MPAQGSVGFSTVTQVSMLCHICQTRLSTRPFNVCICFVLFSVDPVADGLCQQKKKRAGRQGKVFSWKTHLKYCLCFFQSLHWAMKANGEHGSGEEKKNKQKPPIYIQKSTLCSQERSILFLQPQAGLKSYVYMSVRCCVGAHTSLATSPLLLRSF